MRKKLPIHHMFNIHVYTIGDGLGWGCKTIIGIHVWHKMSKKFECLKNWGLHYFIIPFCISKIGIIAK
jgi:hypothetical protein